MKNALHILALLVILAAGIFGYQLKAKYEAQLAETADFVGKNTNISKAIDEKRAEKEEVTKVRTENLSARDTANADLELVSSKSGQLRSTLAKIKERMAASQAELDKINQGVEGLNLEADVTIEELPALVESLKAEKASKEKRLEELEFINTKVTKDIATMQSDLTREQGVLSDSRERVSANKFEAPIVSVNSDWGFVIVGAGENSGLTGNSKLLVKRGGRLIGKLTISSLESNQAIAEVVPDSVAIGVRIQSGDRVILEETVAN